MDSMNAAKARNGFLIIYVNTKEKLLETAIKPNIFPKTGFLKSVKAQIKQDIVEKDEMINCHVTDVGTSPISKNINGRGERTIMAPSTPTCDAYSRCFILYWTFSVTPCFVYPFRIAVMARTRKFKHINYYK